MNSLFVSCARLFVLAALVVLTPLSASVAQEATIAIGGKQGGPRQIGIEDMRKIGAVDLRTSTPWTEGPQVFTGITGAQLAKYLGASGGSISAEALNGYKVVIPWAVFASDSLLVAYARNGQPMSVRDKGPYWVVFPFDSDPKFQSDTYKSYAIWSISRLEFQ